MGMIFSSANYCFLWILLIHWGRVTHTCISKLTIVGSDTGLSPSHYLNQCQDIVYRTLTNILQWNFNRNSYIFIQENAYENAIWKMEALLSRPQCVNSLGPSNVHISDLGNTGSGNGLFPDGTKPLPEWMWIISSVRSCDIHLRAFPQDTFSCYEFLRYEN